MAKASLVCKAGFSAFGKDYRAGQEISIDDTLTWPDGTLARRLNNEFVVWAAAEEAPAPVSPKMPRPTTPPTAG